MHAPHPVHSTDRPDDRSPDRSRELTALWTATRQRVGPAREGWLAALAHQGHPLLPALQRVLRREADAPAHDEFASADRVASLQRFAGLPPAGAPARCLGPYRLLRRLACHDAAETWLAEHRVTSPTSLAPLAPSPGIAAEPGDGNAWAPDGEAARVIVRRLRPHRPGDAPAARFLQRANRLRRASEHVAAARAGIETSIDAGIGLDGHPWFAVAPVRGEPIAMHCERLALPRAARAGLLRRVEALLAPAHALGLGHGGLSDATVLVDAEGRVRLCAHGLARLEREWLLPGTDCAADVGDAADIAADALALSALGERLLGPLAARPSARSGGGAAPRVYGTAGVPVDALPAPLRASACSTAAPSSITAIA